LIRCAPYENVPKQQVNKAITFRRAAQVNTGEGLVTANI
jgi:hypothetical protein